MIDLTTSIHPSMLETQQLDKEEDRVLHLRQLLASSKFKALVVRWRL
jgi:hypothetical protein